MTSALVEPTVNLRVPAGGRFRRTFTAPLGSNGQPLTVTGWAARGQIRAATGSAKIYWTWPEGQITCSGTSVTVRIPISVSSLWVWRTGFYQIEVIDPGDSQGVYRVARGTVVVAPWSMGASSDTPTVDLFTASFSDAF